jgi:hypothetical protein
VDPGSLTAVNAAVLSASAIAPAAAEIWNPVVMGLILLT